MDHQKNSFERRAYEPTLGYVPKNDEKKNLDHERLKLEGVIKKIPIIAVSMSR